MAIEFVFRKRKEKFDSILKAHFEVNKGPLGSTDRKCSLDIDALYEELNAPQSDLAEMWTEKSITSWVRTLGKVCPEFTLIGKVSVL